MSERWIKVCHETRRKPEVIQIARRLGLKGSAGRRIVIGTLVDMWILFDEQTTDGRLSGFSFEDLDAEIDCPGFAEAAAAVGWLEASGEALVMPHFDEHTSQSAKTRASDNRRKRISRMAAPEFCPDLNRTKTGPEETRPEETRPEETRKDRNGTGPAAEPSRAEVSDSSESQAASRSASVKLHQFAKLSPLLQELEKRPVNGSGVLKHGSIFGRDRLRPDHITTAEPAFWLNWYQDQLSSDSPELRCGNQAEAAFVLAAVYAVRRIPEHKLTKAPRVAVWIRWMKERECGSILPGDFDKAAAIVASHFGGDRPAALPVWRDVEPAPKPSSVPEPLPPEQKTKRSFRESIRKLRTAEAAST